MLNQYTKTATPCLIHSLRNELTVWNLQTSPENWRKISYTLSRDMYVLSAVFPRHS
jgi:hypothetical protein